MSKPPPAFPAGNWGGGMRLRDWFAGQSMTGSAPSSTKPETFAKWAYEMADAMMIEREKDPTPSE